MKNLYSILTLILLTKSQQKKIRTRSFEKKNYQTNNISFEKFIELLYTESTEEYNGIDNNDIIVKLWEDQTNYDWERAEIHESTSQGDQRSPFIVCHDDPFLSPLGRKKQLLEHVSNTTNSTSNILTIKNSKQSTCFILYTKASSFESLYNDTNKEHIFVQPMSYSMKLLSGTVNLVEELLKSSDVSGTRRLNKERKLEEEVGTVLVDVLLCPGVVPQNATNETIDTMNNTTNEMKEMIQNLTNILNSTNMTDISEMTNNISDKLNTIQQNASSTTSEILNNTKEILNNATNKAKEVLQNMTDNVNMTDVKETVGDALDNLQDSFGDMMVDVGNYMDDNGRKRRRLSKKQDEIRIKVLDHVKSSFQNELYFLSNASSSNITNIDDIDEKNLSPRMKFWKDVLAIKEENVTIQDDICTLSYEYIDFIFTTKNKANLNMLTLDFTNLIQKVIQEEAKLTSQAEKEQFDQIVKQCQICILKLILSLSTLPEVCIIQTRHVLSVNNYNAQWLVQSGKENYMPLYDVGLNGKGEVVAVSDTGIDLDHCYFDESNYVFGRPFTLDLTRRKVVQYDNYVDGSDYEYGHGTHVAGSVAGCKADGGGIAKGIAYEAKLAFIDIGRSDGSLITPDVDRLLNTGSPYAYIHSASWGGSYPGYGLLSYFFDAYAYYDNDELLVLIAAGNSGNDDAAETVGEPATAKNIIAVGSGHSYGDDLSSDMLGPAYISDFSSRGPTLDGRTKPEIIAPGQWVVSAGARPDQIGECDPSNGKPPGPNQRKDGLASFQGTSMATPITAGSAALIRQYLREGFYPTGEKNETNSIPHPSSALIKAILLNGAQYMKGVDNDGKITNVYPYDNTQNFGRVSLIDSLFIKDKTNIKIYLRDHEVIRDGEEKVYDTISIDMSGGCTITTFSVTLVWTDPPGLSGCATCLINDLDLFVIKNGDESITYYPNGLTTKDSKNNAERVRIENVQDKDTFTIYIKGDGLLSEYQKYAVVASGCFPGSTYTGIGAAEGNVYEGDNSAEQTKNNWTTIVIVVCVIIGVVFAGLTVGYYFKK